MRLPFKQGIVTANAVLTTPAFIKVLASGEIVLDVSTSPFVASGFSAGDDVLIKFPASASNPSWGVVDTSTRIHLFVGVNTFTGKPELTTSRQAPIVATAMPSPPLSEQVVFNPNTRTTRVWNGSHWNTTIRVYVGSVLNGVVTHSAIGISGVECNVYSNAGYILFDMYGNVLRKRNSSTFLLTSDTFTTNPDAEYTNLTVDNSVLFAKTSSAVSAFQLVSVNSDFTVSAASYDDIGSKVVGFALNAAAPQGSITYQTGGFVTNTNWNWTIGSANVWLTPQGELTTTDPRVANPLLTKTPPIARVVSNNTLLILPQ